LNKALLTSEVQEFIFTYKEDISKLAFSGSPFSEISTTELLQQIESRRTIEKKLPTWHQTKKIVYPPKLNLEQTSSEPTAHYKAGLVQGQTLADLTGGFGVDSFYFAENFESITYFDTNKSLSVIAAHNATIFGKKNIDHVAKDGIEAICNLQFDVLYLDPSRRSKSKGKVFFLNDCEPNVPKHLAYLLARCNTLLLKTSPMLDISIGLQELMQVAEIHVVALQNEVKELLWVIHKNPKENVTIHTVNLSPNTAEHFSFEMEKVPEIVYAAPLRFLYEPNAAIMKAGGFQHISEAFKLKKLHKHSHLFTSEALREFPGRRFSIDKVVPYTKKEMRGITFAKANITTRNFPESVATLRKKWNIKEGGDVYLFFTTLENEDKIMLICAKV